jgi:putative ABC transport system permease protein
MRFHLSGLRQAMRSLSRSPGFTLSATATLGLGVAATVVIFSTYYHLIVRPLPFDGWQQLNYIFLERDEGRFAIQPSPELVRVAMESSTTLDALEAWVGEERPLTGRGEPVMLRGARMTPGLPGLVGVSPILGRVFTDAEARAGAGVVLLSERFWRGTFGGDASILGQTVQLGPDPWTVIGVMPAHFSRYDRYDGTEQDYWIPVRLEEVQWGLSSLARIRPGVAQTAVLEELAALQGGLPDGNRIMGSTDWTFTLKSAAEISGASMNARTALPRLLAAAALLLLISCANVAGLLLVRVQARVRDIAVRAAMGASRARLLGELATEQAVIGLLAGVIGVGLAAWTVDAIRALRPDSLAVLDHVTLNLPILAFAAATVLVTTMLLGVLPALVVLRRDLALTIQAGGPRATAGTRTRSVLVTLQLALSTVLLVAGLLLVRTVQLLEGTDLGFDASGLLVAHIPLPDYRYDEASARVFMEDLAEAVGAIPDVESVAIANAAPPRMGLTFVESLNVEGSDVSTEGITFLSGGAVAPGFFATLRARFVEGGTFDDAPSSGDVVVSSAFVDRFWPGQTGVGRRFRMSARSDWKTIVGVLADMRQDGPTHSLSDLTMFFPMAYGSRDASLIIRSRTDPAALAPAVRQVVLARDPDLPIRQMDTMERRMAGTMAAQRFNMIMLAGFAGVAALLCAVGLYGLIAYSLQQRVREVGVRVALGASPVAVRTMFMRQAVRLGAMGVALGLAAALVSTRLMETMIHGIGARDPVSFGLSAVSIAVIVLASSWVPARRAARVQPLDALREQ